MTLQHYGTEFSIPDHWDTGGEITAESDAKTEYLLWKRTAKEQPDLGWSGGGFELADFERYIEKLQKEKGTAMTKEQKYNQAGESLVDWVEQCQEAELDAAITSTLLLDSAIDLCFHVMGPEKAMEAVDTMMRLKLREYGDKGLERN